MNPEFSIIIAANNGVPEAEFFRCLSKLSPQEGDFSFECLVVMEEEERLKETFPSRFPWARPIFIPKMMRGSYPRNLALTHAGGNYILFLEDHVMVEPNHLSKIRQVFEKGYDAVGGAVVNGSPGFPASWLQYFCEYHRWLPCRPSGEIDDLPGCNFAYRAPTLKNLGAFVEGRYKIETLFNVRARKQGARFYFSANAGVIHFAYDAKTVPEYWRYRFQYGREFASNRGLGNGKRILFALFSPCLSGVAFIRIWSDIRHDREMHRRFWRMSPLLLLSLAIWSMGEFCGYLGRTQGQDHAQSRRM